MRCLRASALRGGSGEIDGVATIARDISDRRRLEQEREALIADLERSNADLEQFAYVASHDLSERLRAVAGLLALLAREYRDDLDATAADYVDRSVAAAARMRALIDDLLAYSRLRQREPQLTSVDTRVLATRCLESLADVLEEAAAEVDVGALPTLVTDQLLLGRVLQNLLANAVKFRGERPLRIALSAARDDGAWRFAVADNGIGVDPRHRERIFQIFKRLHPRERYAGTGIGLAVCDRAVTRLGGRIWAGDAPGGGAVFSFTLPDRSPP